MFHYIEDSLDYFGNSHLTKFIDNLDTFQSEADKQIEIYNNYKLIWILNNLSQKFYVEFTLFKLNLIITLNEKNYVVSTLSWLIIINF